MYTVEQVNQIFSTPLAVEELTRYCQALAHEYNQTLDGPCRIKYNALYKALELGDAFPEKRAEFFNTFLNSYYSNEKVDSAFVAAFGKGGKVDEGSLKLLIQKMEPGGW